MDEEFEDLMKAGAKLYQVSDFNGAIESYSRASLIKPLDPRPKFNLALARTRKRAYREAFAEVNSAIMLMKEGDGVPEAYYLRGLILEYLLRFADAVGSYTVALRADPFYEKAKKQREIAWGKVKMYGPGSIGN